MGKSELIRALEALVARAGEENPETLAAVGILNTLLGAMHAGEEDILLEVTAQHTIDFLHRAKQGKCQDHTTC